MTLLLAVMACKKDPEAVPATEELDGWAAVSVEVGSATGEGTVDIPVRLVNAYGVAVPGGDVTVSLAGTELAETTQTIALDGQGWGVATISSEVPQEVTITVTGSSDGAETGARAKAWITAASPPEVAMYPGWPSTIEPESMVSVEGGMAIALGSSVWWQTGNALAPMMRVADLPNAIGGMVGGDIDSDGVPDLVVWTANEVVLLRGRGQGGFTWGGGFSAPGFTLAGAAIADVDGDNAADLVVGISNGADGGFQVLLGTGAWGWEGGDPHMIQNTVWAVAAGDLGGDGAIDVAVLQPNSAGRGVVRRYGENTDGWYANGLDLGDNLDLPLQPGSGLQPCTDIDGDGSDEVIVTSAPGGAARNLAFYTFDGNPKQFEIPYNGFNMAIGEVTGDGLPDILLTETDPDQLRVVTSDSDETRFYNRSISALPVQGPVGVGDFNGDGVADAIVASEVLALYPGQDDGDEWDLLADGFRTYGVAAVGPQWVGELDGDGWAEVLAVRELEGRTYLQSFHFYEAGQDDIKMQSPGGHRIDLDGTSTSALASGIDMAICDGVAYVLTEDDGRWLWSINLDDNGEISERNHIEVDADRLACGALETGGTVATLAADGTVEVYGKNLGSINSTTLAGSFDLVIADADGLGPALHGCQVEGCTLDAADLDDDGLDEIIAGGTEAWARGWSVDFIFEYGGETSIVDFDGDGRLDVLYTDIERERLIVYRSLETSFGSPLVYHGVRDLEGPAFYVDGDGDGVNELFFPAPEGNLLRSAVSGG